MRIISLSPSNTEILAALGVMDDVVAVTHLCDFPESVRGKHRIGTWITTDADRLRDMNPDIIFTSYFLPRTLQRWNGPGEIVHVKPATLAEVYESIMIIGETLGKKNEAKKVVEGMKMDLNTIAKKKITKRHRVYMEEWHSPPFASGNWVPELVHIAGGTEILGKRGEPSSEFDFKNLEKEDPDIIVCHWCGTGEKADIERVSIRPGWDKLRAVRYGRIFSVDDSLVNRPGPRLIDGTRMLHGIFSAITR